MKRKTILNLCFLVAMLFLLGIAGQAYALPSLQLGPELDPDTGEPISDWTYVPDADPATGADWGTWVVSEGSFNLNAYALDSAWAAGQVGDQTAFLVASAVGNVIETVEGEGVGYTGSDYFGLTMLNDNVSLSYVAGYGNAPIVDDNKLPPHGVFPTYYEIYEFDFDQEITITGLPPNEEYEGFTDVYNTQPQQPGGETGTQPGYSEIFDITIDWLAADITGIHFDLYTLYNAEGNVEVYNFAPFSHDAEYNPIPEPATMLLFGAGLMGLAGFRRKFIKK